MGWRFKGTVIPFDTIDLTKALKHTVEFKTRTLDEGEAWRQFSSWISLMKFRTLGVSSEKQIIFPNESTTPVITPDSPVLYLPAVASDITVDLEDKTKEIESWYGPPEGVTKLDILPVVVKEV